MLNRFSSLQLTRSRIWLDEEDIGCVYSLILAKISESLTRRYSCRAFAANDWGQYGKLADYCFQGDEQR